MDVTRKMVNRRYVEISDETFGGFRVQTDLDEVETLDDIVGVTLNLMKAKLQEGNFQALLSVLGKKEFHIHDMSFEDCLMNEGQKIWVCGHCSD